MMLSRFFNSTPRPSSCFENYGALKVLDDLLSRLRNKVSELEDESKQSGASYFNRAKYQIMESLLTGITLRIVKFKQPDKIHSYAEKLQFTDDLLKFIIKTFNENYEALNWHRNCRREVAGKALTTVVEASANGLSLGVALSYPLAGIALGPATYFYAAPWLSAKAQKATGLNNQETASVRLLREWVLALEKLAGYYSDLVDKNDNDNASSAAAAARIGV